MEEYTQGEINLRELTGFLLKYKFLISSITSVGAILSVLFALSLSNYFQSSALLKPTESNSSSSALSQFGGLASLAGINIPSGASGETQLIIETLRSRDFLGRIILNHEILADLLATDYFDHAKGEIVHDSDQYDKEKKIWIRDVNYPFKPEPSVLEAYETYMETVIVEHNEITDYITIYVEHKSPIFAKNFLEVIILELNKSLREKAYLEADMALNYLREEIVNEKINSLKEALVQLTESQLNTKMITNIKDDYAVTIVDKPYVPEKKSKPQRSIICIIGTILSLFISLVIAYFIDRRKRSEG